MTSPETPRCTLCDLPADEAVSDDAVEGPFCCRGCLEVYRTLGDVDVSAADVRATATADGQRQVPDDAATAYLTVDGMHCTTCEAFLETVALECEGVHDCTASYAAETVRVAHDQDACDETAIADALSRAGYVATPRGADTEADAEEGAASRLLVGGIFGMMAMVWYALFLYPTYFGYEPVVSLGTFDGAYLYGQLAVATAVVLFYTGWPTLRRAYVSLRVGRPNVALLVSVAALAAFCYSTGRLLLGESDLYYDVTIVVVLAVTVGNYYERRIKRRAAGLLADLSDERDREARRPDGETVSIADVAAGDRLLVRPGERIPVDGTVREGTAAVDESLVTGESLPIDREPGDAVRGGTVVTDDPLVVEAGAGAESTLDRLVDRLWEIQTARTGAQRLADRLATVFVPLVVTLALLAAGWLVVTGAPAREALLVGLTVVIVACPCALGLATPLAVAAGLRSALERGVVVTSTALFESADAADTVVFDKTGTLTTGEMSVTDVAGVRADVDEVLARAGALEQLLDHPVATAIASAAEAEGGADTDARSADVDGFETGRRAVAGTVRDDRVVAGHPGAVEECGWTVPAEVSAAVEAARERGDRPVVVGWDGTARGVISVGDEPREGWTSVLRDLAADRRVVVLTGDDGPAADRFRGHDAVDDVYAGVPPEGKVETVRRLAESDTVAMVGDGSNDAPALATADVGIALDEGTDLATEAADAVVTDGDLRSVPAVFETVAATNRRVRGNLAWAFLYNAVAIPLAISGLLNPLFAAVAMATSSLVVVANSARIGGSADCDRATRRKTGESNRGPGAPRTDPPVGPRADDPAPTN